MHSSDSAYNDERRRRPQILPSVLRRSKTAGSSACGTVPSVSRRYTSGKTVHTIYPRMSQTVVEKLDDKMHTHEDFSKQARESDRELTGCLCRAPVMKWGVVLAGAADFLRPAEKLSLQQNLALMATGSIWTRWCFVIKPKNMLYVIVLDVARGIRCANRVRIVN